VKRIPTNENTVDGYDDVVRLAFEIDAPA